MSNAAAWAQTVKAFVKRQLGLADLADFERLKASADELKSDVSRLQSAAAIFPLPKWWESNFWEPTVQLPIRDFCKPGDVAFDVGANAGGLTLLMSRLVGPRGLVCAFEASPRIIDKTQWNLVQAGCFNTQLYFRAVYHTSRQWLRLYEGTHLNDSVYNRPLGDAGASYEVETLALDDFVAETGLTPSFIKMDIECAEFDALTGMARLIAEERPVYVLEQSAEDPRCYDLLTTAGYRAVDLSSYRSLPNKADFAATGGIANILFVHPESHPASPYLREDKPILVATLSATDFERDATGSVRLVRPLSLSPGRYMFKILCAASGTDNEVFAGLETDQEMIFRYHAYSHLLASFYRNWVIHLARPTDVRLFFRFIRGTDSTLRWDGAEVYRLPAFDGMRYSAAC